MNHSVEYAQRAAEALHRNYGDRHLPEPQREPVRHDMATCPDAGYWLQAAQEVLFALPEPSPEPGLDAAWAEAEAALPEGWSLSVFRTFSGPTLGYGIEAAWVESLDNDEFAGVDKRLFAHGPTAAAALRALAARLRERQPELGHDSPGFDDSAIPPKTIVPGVAAFEEARQAFRLASADLTEAEQETQVNAIVDEVRREQGANQ